MSVSSDAVGLLEDLLRPDGLVQPLAVARMPLADGVHEVTFTSRLDLYEFPAGCHGTLGRLWGALSSHPDVRVQISDGWDDQILYRVVKLEVTFPSMPLQTFDLLVDRFVSVVNAEVSYLRDLDRIADRTGDAPATFRDWLHPSATVFATGEM